MAVGEKKAVFLTSYCLKWPPFPFLLSLKSPCNFGNEHCPALR